MNQRPDVKDATGRHIGVSDRPAAGILSSGRTDQAEPTCAKRCAKRLDGVIERAGLKPKHRRAGGKAKRKRATVQAKRKRAR